jgi:hypothetical protein
MAANKKAPITVTLQNDGSLYSLHHDLAGHFRMDRAVVGIRSCLGERVREFLVRVHHLGLGCSDGYRDRLRPKNEIIDLHRHVCSGGLVGCCDAR